ncbi:hypothetical protein IVA86_40855 [Bradyrhizobium sp. 146]|nr:hypothetical protein [Bradyrhizobium sp. CW11]MCK1707582.1 hypothetical protein [Bradyrhizobium sp. 146]
MIVRNAQNIAFARMAQQSFDLSRAIHAVRRNNENSTFAAIAPAIMRRAIFDLVESGNRAAHALPSSECDHPSMPLAGGAHG